MRPWVPLGFLLGLTGPSLVQVCTGNGFSLLVCMCVIFLYVTDCGLLLQRKAGRVGWWSRWRKQASKKFAGC